MLALHINPYQDSYPSKQKVYIFAFTYPKKEGFFSRELGHKSDECCNLQN